MRKLALFAAVVCLISCYGMNANAGNGTTYVYVGNSTSTVGARSGLAGMNQTCRNTIAGSRMCTADEFFGSIGIPSSQTNQGATMLWVQPSLNNCVYDPSQSATMCMETGLLPPASSTTWPFEPATTLGVNCAVWTSKLGTDTGTVVSFTTGASGGWETTTDVCSNSHKVACCKD